jgi:hypothetical protein
MKQRFWLSSACGIVAMLSVGCAGSSYLRVSSDQLAPGVTYTHYRTVAPQEIHVVAVDLRTPGLSVEAIRANGLVPTSKVVAEASTPDRPIVAAVNADFFSFTSHWPVGNQVSHGEIVTGIGSRRSHFVITADGKPRMERLTFAGSAESPRGTWKIDQLNQPLSRRGSAFYTPRWKDSIDTRGGKAAWLTQLGRSNRWVVDSVGVFSGVALVRSGVLAFGSRTIDTLGASVPASGDTVNIQLGFRPELKNVVEAVGGGGRILYDGAPVGEANVRLESIAPDFLTKRHPRTFVGIDADSTALFLCVVDGRQESSDGMNFEEMADFLRSLGVYQAVNLDGGGSTTMVVNGRIVNSPSDKTGERPVANTLVVRRTL